jgi:hypothetical protein
MTRLTFALTGLLLAGAIASAPGPAPARAPSVAISAPHGRSGPTFSGIGGVQAHHFGYVRGVPGRSGHAGHGGNNGHGGNGHSGHRDGHQGNWQSGNEFWGGAWGCDEDGDGYVNTIPIGDEDGFFATGGEVVQNDGRAPTYDYDRGYPYDWYNPAASVRVHRTSLSASPGRHLSCDTSSVPGASGGRVAIRVCRGN